MCPARLPNEGDGKFSTEPNPHYVAYHSDQTGHLEVYIDTFPQPRGPVRVSTASGLFPKWAPGGRELFSVILGEFRVEKFSRAVSSFQPFSAKPRHALSEAEDLSKEQAWSSDGTVERAVDFLFKLDIKVIPGGLGERTLSISTPHADLLAAPS